MHPLTTHLLYIIRTRNLISSGGRVVVAVSGGVDSLALLHMLHHLKDTLHLRLLHVATFDHGLRGAHGAQDAAFVAQVAQEWGLSVSTGTAHPDIPKSGIEANARRMRYRFLAQVAHTVQADTVITAHHAGDQAETILMNIIRGTGIGGISGMKHSATVPDHPDLTLIRPLLEVPRADIEAYCAAHNLQPRTDATNSDTRYRRNRLRHEVLPLLAHLNPQIEAALGRLASTAQLQNEFVEKSLWKRLNGHFEYAAMRWTVSLEVYCGLHPALRHHFLRTALDALGSDSSGTVHILHADEVACRAQVGSIAEFPDGLQLRVDYDRLYIEQADAPQILPEDLILLPENAEIRLNPNGVTRCASSWGIAISEQRPQHMPHAAFHIPEGADVLVRTRRAGDRFKPRGLGGHSQKINKWMIDHKIPAHWRTRIPLFIIDNQIRALILRGEWVLTEPENLNEDVSYSSKFTFIIPM